MTLLERWTGTTEPAELMDLLRGPFAKARFWLGIKIIGEKRLHAYAEGWHRLRAYEERHPHE